PAAVGTAVRHDRRKGRAAQYRNRARHSPLPRPVSVGLQPLQAAGRRAPPSYLRATAMTRIAIFLLWLLHWLPLPLLAPLGRGLGRLLPVLIPKRRHVVETNLRLCFPEMSAAQRQALAREHFALLGRSLLERSLLWWASEKRLRRI